MPDWAEVVEQRRGIGNSVGFEPTILYGSCRPLLSCLKGTEATYESQGSALGPEKRKKGLAA